MKKIFTLAAFLVPFIVFGQNKVCTNSTLSIDLKTPEKVFHQKGTPYPTINPVAFSTVHPFDKIQLVKKPTDVDPNFTGIYFECYEATDIDGLKVECCRTVTVMNQVPGALINLEPFQISVFPNPVKHKQITVHFSGVSSSENINLILFDLLGQEILNNSYPASESDIHISTEDYSLNSGLYILTVKQGDALINKIIVL